MGTKLYPLASTLASEEKDTMQTSNAGRKHRSARKMKIRLKTTLVTGCTRI